MTPDRPLSSQSDLSWTDLDGDKITFSCSEAAIGHEAVLGCVQIIDGETGAESAAYVDEADARAVIAWLTERLQSV